MFNGFVYDGDLEVGKFKYSGKNLTKQIKTINSLSISKEYIDICREASLKQLSFIYFIDDIPIILGFGPFYYNGGSFVSIKNIEINECFLINSLNNTHEN